MIGFSSGSLWVRRGGRRGDSPPEHGSRTLCYRRPDRLIVIGSLLALVVAFGGCATAPGNPNGVAPAKRDPLQPINRFIFRFDMMLDKAVMRPIAKEYTRVTPKGVRAHIHDFFTNLVMPVTIVNDLLQLKPIHAVKDTGRFLTDSTIGLAGFFHPATRWGMPPHYEDFGITLARWGVPSGPYVVLPFFGPSDLRDALGLYTDSYATPVRYFDNIKLRNGVLMGQAVDTRAQYLDYDQMLRQAYDPYALMRSAYFQNRDHTIRQNIPGARQEELPNYNEMLKNPGHGNGGAKQMPPQ